MAGRAPAPLGDHVPPKLTKASLLAWITAQGRPVRRREMTDHFAPGLTGKAAAARKDLVRALLAQLADEGAVAPVGRAWAAASTLPAFQATLDIRRSGHGVVRHPELGSIPIAPEDLADAWPGDLVEVLLVTERREPRGRVRRVVERRTTQVPLVLERALPDGLWLARPTDPRMPLVAQVELAGMAASAGDMVLGTAPEAMGPKLFRFTAAAHLGPEARLATQEAMVKLVHAIPQRFPEAALAEAAALPEAPEDWSGRTDLRGLPLVTIDDERARDFDDAIFVEETAVGFRLVVAIADVAHSVRPGSALDAEAQERGNSYYFPLSVEPMLPERLSNGLCSLRPGVPRLAMAVDLAIGRDGRLLAAHPLEAVIESHARLTYTAVQRLLDGDAGAVPAALTPMLQAAARLTEVLWQARLERGTLDLDIPEAVVREEPGGAVTVTTRPRLFAHRIVEECMIAANEAVASLLEGAGRVFPYRVHPAPDPAKMEALFRHLAASGIIAEVPHTLDLRALQAVLAQASGTPHEDLVHRLVLRSLMQAAYAPTNEGHFGLASAAYCHFTSPIRRYADLLTHRALKALLRREPDPFTAEGLAPLCEAMNGCERRAVEAERDMARRAAILALQGREGEVFEAMVSGVAEFGFWVELADMPADGMVRLATLDEFWSFDPQRQELLGTRSGQRLALGDRVQVVLLEASLARGELNFTLAHGSRTAPRNTPGRRGQRRPPRRTTPRRRTRR